jgi:hypothetical protein
MALHKDKNVTPDAYFEKRFGKEELDKSYKEALPELVVEAKELLSGEPCVSCGKLTTNQHTSLYPVRTDYFCLDCINRYLGPQHLPKENR